MCGCVKFVGCHFFQCQHISVGQGPTFLSCANASGGLVNRPAASKRMYANLSLLGCFCSRRHAEVPSAETEQLKPPQTNLIMDHVRFVLHDAPVTPRHFVQVTPVLQVVQSLGVQLESVGSFRNLLRRYLQGVMRHTTSALDPQCRLLEAVICQVQWLRYASRVRGG